MTTPDVGDVAPNFEAVAADGAMRTLAELCTQPLVLVFYRGHW